MSRKGNAFPLLLPACFLPCSSVPWPVSLAPTPMLTEIERRAGTGGGEFNPELNLLPPPPSRSGVVGVQLANYFLTSVTLPAILVVT